MVDGRQKLIVNNVIEEYAYFIAQRLDERLHADAEPDVSRLEEVEHLTEHDEEAYRLTEMKGEADTRDH